jgi:hypothetical protein
MFPCAIVFDEIDQRRERPVQYTFAGVMVAGFQSVAPNLMKTTEPVYDPLKKRTAPLW